MKKYRVKEIDGKFYPQERYFLFFWNNINVSGVTKLMQPEFNTLGRAKLFIEEYKKSLERKSVNQKAKYYY